MTSIKEPFLDFASPILHWLESPTVFENPRKSRILQYCERSELPLLLSVIKMPKMWFPNNVRLWEILSIFPLDMVMIKSDTFEYISISRNWNKYQNQGRMPSKACYKLLLWREEPRKNPRVSHRFAPSLMTTWQPVLALTIADRRYGCLWKIHTVSKSQGSRVGTSRTWGRSIFKRPKTHWN